MFSVPNRAAWVAINCMEFFFFFFLLEQASRLTLISVMVSKGETAIIALIS